MDTSNPFILDFNLATYWSTPEVKKGNGLDVSGNVVHIGLVKEQREVVRRDVSPFVKFFKGSFSKIKDLGSPGLAIIEYIITNIKSGHDTVHLPVKDVVQQCGYKTRKTYYIGIKQLVDAGIIAGKDKKHNFWINPNIFFKGDRRKIKR